MEIWELQLKTSPKGLTTELNKHMPGSVLGVCDTPDPWIFLWGTWHHIIVDDLGCALHPGG